MTQQNIIDKSVEAKEAASCFGALDNNLKAYIQGVIDGANFAKQSEEKEISERKAPPK